MTVHASQAFYVLYEFKYTDFILTLTTYMVDYPFMDNLKYVVLEEGRCYLKTEQDDVIEVGPSMYVEFYKVVDDEYHQFDNAISNSVTQCRSFFHKLRETNRGVDAFVFELDAYSYP